MNHEIKQGEIVIELDHPKNSDVVFTPANDSFRSRLRPGRSGARYPATFNQFIVDGVPGQRIHVDRKTHIGRITDGLGANESKQVRKDLEEACRKSNVPSLSNAYGYNEPIEKSLEEEDEWTWLFWMRRLVDCGYAKEVSGKVPPEDEIRKSGMAKRFRYGGQANVPDYFMTKEEEKKWVKDQPRR